jgi:hypothetical protein
MDFARVFYLRNELASRTIRVNEIIRRRTFGRASCRISSPPLRGKLTFYGSEQVRKYDAEWLMSNFGDR